MELLNDEHEIEQCYTEIKNIQNEIDQVEAMIE